MAMERHSILHEATGVTFESMAVYDPQAGEQPGILLFPNFLGTKEWDFVRAEKIAALGFKVLVVDYYGQGRRAESVSDPRAGEYMNELTADRAVMRDRLLAALAELRKLPGVDVARCAAIGFCLGGKCVLDLARAGADILGGVSYHGVYDAPPFPNAKMTAKLLICHGWNDPMCPPEVMKGLADELTEAGVDWQIHAYGHTGHAFTADNVPMNDANSFGFQPDADRRSWQATLNFFGEIFG